MSGWGRYQDRGNYHGCRGSGKSSKPNSEKKNNTGSTSSNSMEIKFVPHYTGKQQMMMYDTIKDHIINQIQNTYKYGGDITQALRDEAELQIIGTGIPTRVKVEIQDRMNNGEQFKLCLEQEGLDIQYKESLRTYNTHTETYEENKIKVFALIFGYWNKVTQNRIEEGVDFETNICNKSIELLHEIKKKLHDPAHSK